MTLQHLHYLTVTDTNMKERIVPILQVARVGREGIKGPIEGKAGDLKRGATRT